VPDDPHLGQFECVYEAESIREERALVEVRPCSGRPVAAQPRGHAAKAAFTENLDESQERCRDVGEAVEEQDRVTLADI
jgi:hypothetical protein